MTEPMTEQGSAAAPAARRVLAQALWEARLVLGNGEQLLLALVLPVLALVGLSRTTLVTLPVATGRTAVDVVAPGVLAMAVMSTAFTGQAITTAFDRRHGVLRLLGTTPLGRPGLLAGRVLAVLGVELLQVVVLSAVAIGLGWRPDPGGVPAAAVLVVAGTAAFAALGLLMAGTLRPEAVLAGANLVWVLLLVGGGVLLPLAELPEPMRSLAAWLPSGALGEGLRVALLDGRADAGALGVLGLWTAAGVTACSRWFRWG